MKIAYLDIIGGISGDMTLAAFISAGVSHDRLTAELQKLHISGFEVQCSHIERNGIVAVKADVIISEQPHHHRHLKDIEELIDKSDLSGTVKERSKKIFREIAAAEAKVHGMELEKVHFHEVGAVDSIVDIVGVSICLEQLGIESVYTSPVKIGSGGLIDSQHGKLPVPAPATVEILKDYPVVLTDIGQELTTPTGAAIIKALSGGILDSEKILVRSVGYGAGERKIEKIPNLLRIILGDLEPEYNAEEIISIETNIDNMNPEFYPYIIEKLLNAGALDAYLTPIIMKKGRPGIILSAMAERSKSKNIIDIFFRETTTLGIRILPIGRKILARSSRQVKTSLGIVAAKEIIFEGKHMLRVEFEECRRIAGEKNIPIGQVYRILDGELNNQQLL